MCARRIDIYGNQIQIVLSRAIIYRAVSERVRGKGRPLPLFSLVVESQVYNENLDILYVF